MLIEIAVVFGIGFALMLGFGLGSWHAKERMYGDLCELYGSVQSKYHGTERNIYLSGVTDASRLLFGASPRGGE